MPKIGTKYFNEKTIRLLAKNKIFTINDFLLTDFEKLAVISKLDEEEVIKLIHTLVSSYSAQQRNGLRLYQHLLKKTRVILTYITGLDELLNGGLITGTIIELCGLSGSGKTQLCLSITINIAMKSEFLVTYIDTKKDFSSLRLLQILKSSNSEENFENILGRINVIAVNDIYCLISLLHSIQNKDCAKLGPVIVLDSLPALFFPFLGLNSNEGLSLLNHIATLLKRISVEQHIAVILTNLGSQYEEFPEIIKYGNTKNNESDTEIKPMLGKYWIHVPNTRLIVSRMNNFGSKRVLSVRKSDYIKIGNNCVVEIFDGGVR